MSCTCSRRQVLRVGTYGLLAMLFSGKLSRLFPQERVARAKACIFLFMQGGPSHIDTWDPKPGTPGGGEFKPVATAAGFQICEHLPQLAALSKRLAVVRSMTSPEADHGRGQYYLRTGYRPSESVTHPTLGAIFAREMAKDDAEIPPYVSLGAPTEGAGGYLGERFAPFSIASPGEVPDTLALPADFAADRQVRRLQLLAECDRELEARLGEESRIAQQLRAQAVRYMEGPFREALDLSREPDEVREQYGRGEEGLIPFGQQCLTARRLIESGVKFVEVMMPDGWDTHADNFNLTRDLCRKTDAGFAALLRDLEARGMLDSTLIIWGGEFGRTPQINDQAGRDHHADAFSVVLAGGGVRGGQVVGATDADGAVVQDRPVTMPDLLATVVSLAGLDPRKEYYTPEGRPIQMVEKGSVVSELVG